MYHFITASKDASIYLQQPSQNTGLDEILEVSKTYYGNLKDIARSFIHFETNHFSSSIVENTIPLVNQYNTSQSIQTEYSQSWHQAESASLYYSASYHIKSASLYESESIYTATSESLNTLINDANVSIVNTFILVSGSVSNLVNTTTALSESFYSQSLFVDTLTTTYGLISASYNIMMNSSFTGSFADSNIETLFNNTSESLVSAISLNDEYSSSYNLSSQSVSLQENELTTLQNYIIASSESSSLNSYELIISASNSYSAALENYLNVSSSSYVISSSYSSYVSSSNYLSSSYNNYSTSLEVRLNNNEFEFIYDAFLILKECESSEIPLSYTIYAYPVSQSWEMGIGTRFDEISTDGITWNHKTSGTNWLLSDSLSAGSTGSYNGKGGTWYTSSVASQSFDYETSDLCVNVKSIVEQWLSGSLPNNGFILKHTSSLENDTNDYGQLKFFSKETNTIYQPKLRIGWDDSTFTTGSLTELTATDIHVTFKKLKTKYKSGSNVEIRVFGREKYPLKTYTNLYSYNDVKYLPATTYYQIKDVATDEVIVPFSDYTKVSCDSNGNFFKLNLSNWETNREYYIEIKTDRDGVVEYFSDKDLTFLIEK